MTFVKERNAECLGERISPKHLGTKHCVSFLIARMSFRLVKNLCVEI